MEILIFGILLLLALAFVGRPLITQEELAVAEAPSTNQEWEALLVQRNAVYASIKELEFDKESGTLSVSDYEDLRQRYTRKAVAILKQINELEATKAAPDETDFDKWIESEVEAVRGKRSRAGLGSSGDSEAIINFCPRCGGRVHPGDAYCVRCGAELA